ncbi:MAG TPA: DUF72 domain-containing protein [Alphaproteobacteria bacterium]|nr:DUF72 domain-containing protein [Alphaproteobacteria bacterium]
MRIGTSGYQYDHWQGVFYPTEIPKKRWFAHYAAHFDTVEINNTFYRLPQDRTFDAWREQAPPGFCYALKFSRYATHLKRLQDPHEPIHRFLDRARHLRGFLGPILVQLPPRWNVDVDRLAGFLDAAPDAYRWAIEFRDPRWLCDEVYALLRRHNAALCIHDLIPDHPRCITADWVYLRFHGTLCGGNYPRPVLTAHAAEIAEYAAAGLDVFAYFNNDAFGYAVHNALDLKNDLRRR